MNSNDQPRTPSDLPALFALASLTLGVGWLFAPTFIRLQQRWDIDPNYSHGYLVGPVSLVLAIFALYRVGRPRAGEVTVALLHIGSGLVIHLAALFLTWPLLDFVALAAILRGTALAVGGRPYAAAVSFPIVFLVFMFPWPSSWMAQAALWLQEAVAVATSCILELFVHSYRQGTSLHIAGVKEPLVVAEECSGLRQIVAFLALAALLGKFSGRGIPFRLVIFLLALPIAVLANVLRVLLMATGAVLYGTKWIEGWLHHAPAMFSLPVGIALLLLLVWLLERLWPAHPKLPRTSELVEAPCPSPSV